MGPLYSNTLLVCTLLSWDIVCSRLRCCSDEVGPPGDGNHSDVNSLSSDLLDILLRSDSRSGTSSATSGSMGSSSNGCGTSARTSNSGMSNNSGMLGCRTSASGTSASGVSGSGTVSSSHTSNNSSNYFGSMDSSQNSCQKVKVHSSGGRSGGSVSQGRPMEVEQSQYDKYVLQDLPWLVTANADDKVMLTYQMPSRGIESVLSEDREKLSVMQKSQPCFTGEQQRELVEVHPWMRRGGLPKVMDVEACVGCEEDAPEAVLSEELPGLDISIISAKDSFSSDINHSPRPTLRPTAVPDQSKTILDCLVLLTSCGYKPFLQQAKLYGNSATA
ncbi:hypothetical protein J4Q44_G00186290 [Coregonus suidteri]|uniref:Period circadian-like C-terminal domain-containing protein n=1 Tax=Coregonus suidteri TaxID=861788 RepID=A0AAN8LIX2_9TELE